MPHEIVPFASVSHAAGLAQERAAEPISCDGGEGEIMLTAVHDFLGRFVAYPNVHAHTAHALWCVHTHLMSLWNRHPGLPSCLPNRHRERRERWKSRSFLFRIPLPP